MLDATGWNGCCGMNCAVDQRRESLRHLVNVHAPHDLEVGRHDLIQRHALQLAHLSFGDAERRHQLVRRTRAGVALHQLQRGTALDRCSMEEPLRGRHRKQCRNLPATARLAKHHHVARVAAKLCDVVAHPFERKDDVEHAGVAGAGKVRPARVFERGESQHVEPMIDRDDHDVAASREVGAFGDRRRSRTSGEASAMTPEHHRALAAITNRRRPHVENEAVFALRRKAGCCDCSRRCVAPNTRLALRCTRPVVDRVAHAGPLRRSDRGHEPVLARGTGAVRNPLEDLDSRSLRSPHASVRGLGSHGRTFGREQRARGPRSTPQSAARILEESLDGIASGSCEDPFGRLNDPRSTS